jgi:hypothetical protein
MQCALGLNTGPCARTKKGRPIWAAPKFLNFSNFQFMEWLG